MKPHILLDVDGVLADFVGHVKATVPEWKHRHDDIHDLDLTKFMFDHEREHYTSRCQQPGWCSKIPWYPQARGFLSMLQQLGTVEILTTPWTTPTWEEERRAWLRPYFDGKITFSKWKAAHAGDVLIEDSSHNLESWWKPGRTPILIDRPWNKQDHFATRATTYAQALWAVRDHE